MSNRHRTDTEHDATMRRQLRRALDDTAPSGDHDALEARVLAQWQQRHDVHAQAEEMVGVGGPGLAGDSHARLMKKRWLLALGLLLAAVLALGWFNRPDPVLEELMQPDVLSQIGLGEL